MIFILIVSYKVTVPIDLLLSVSGYCARYSTDKKRVEENFENGFDCMKFEESENCPTRYPSTDAYKCKYT